jgi:hypothetical protein
MLLPDITSCSRLSAAVYRTYIVYRSVLASSPAWTAKINNCLPFLLISKDLCRRGS